MILKHRFHKRLRINFDSPKDRIGLIAVPRIPSTGMYNANISEVRIIVTDVYVMLV